MVLDASLLNAPFRASKGEGQLLLSAKNKAEARDGGRATQRNAARQSNTQRLAASQPRNLATSQSQTDQKAQQHGKAGSRPDALHPLILHSPSPLSTLLLRPVFTSFRHPIAYVSYLISSILWLPSWERREDHISIGSAKARRNWPGLPKPSIRTISAASIGPSQIR